MSDSLSRGGLPPGVLEALETDAALRAAAVARHLPTMTEVSRLVDRLGELHRDLAPDDRLHQVLHSLGFVWGYVEAELMAAARQRRN